MFELSLSDKRGQSCTHLGNGDISQAEGTAVQSSQIGKEVSSRIKEEAKWLAISEEGEVYR